MNLHICVFKSLKKKISKKLSRFLLSCDNAVRGKTVFSNQSDYYAGNRSKQTGTDIQTDIHTYIHTYIHTDIYTDIQTDIYTDRQIDR